MKPLITLLVLLILSLTANAQNGISIEVTINNVRSSEGSVIFSLHTEATFMKGPGIQNAVVTEIKDGTAKAVFENVAPGTYAIMAMHDVNNNKTMDYEPNGMPKEDYGMSNNDMAFGPPSFDAAKFEVSTENLQLDIRF